MELQKRSENQKKNKSKKRIRGKQRRNNREQMCGNGMEYRTERKTEEKYENGMLEVISFTTLTFYY
ncbi:MAG: hypothetical protein RR139_02540 [Lachnospiraceae bacterium]